jgi:hypothetical protein
MKMREFILQIQEEQEMKRVEKVKKHIDFDFF